MIKALHRLTSRRKGRAFERTKYRQPVRLALRQLEQRRVLDVSAAFITATGQLDITLSQANETATIGAAAGQISVTDQENQSIPILIDGGSGGKVRLSSVESLRVQGSSAADQAVVIDTFLVPANGLRIESSIELARLNQSVTFVTQNGIEIAAGTIHLGADLESSTITLGSGQSEILLNSDVTLTADSIDILGQIDDDGDSSSGSSLLLDVSASARLQQSIGARAPIDQLQTTPQGAVQLGSSVTANGEIRFRNPVLLEADTELRSDGTIRFDQSVDSRAGENHSLILAAGDGIGFSGSIGAGASGDQRLGDITVLSAGGGVRFGETAGIASVRASGSLTLGESSVLGGPGIVLRGDSISGLTLDVGGALRFNGRTQLNSDAALLAQGGIVFSPSSPIDSLPNTTHRLLLDAGQSSIVLSADIGSETPLGGLQVIRAAGGVSLGDPTLEGLLSKIRSTGPIDIGVGENVITGTGIVVGRGVGRQTLLTTTGDTIRLNGATTIASDLSLDTGAGRGDVLLTAAATVDSHAGDRHSLRIMAGQGKVSFDGDLGESTALGVLEIAAAGRGVLFGENRLEGAAGQLFVVADHGIQLGSIDPIRGEGIVFSGDLPGVLLATAGADLRINGPVTAARSVVLSSGDGDLVFTSNSSINGVANRQTDLNLSAGRGAVRFNADIGREHSLGSLAIASAGRGIHFGESATRTTAETGPVRVVRAARIAAGSADQVIGGDGIVLQGGLVAGINITAHAGGILVNGPVSLRSAAMVGTSADSGGSVTFTSNSTLDGASGQVSDLRIAAGGDVTFLGDVGSFIPLGSLTVTGNSIVVGAPADATHLAAAVQTVRAFEDITFAAASQLAGGSISFFAGDQATRLISGGGSIQFDGPVLLASDLHIDTGTGDVQFSNESPIDSAAGLASGLEPSLIVNAGTGALRVFANVGERQPLGALIVERATAGVTFGAEAAEISGPVTLVSTTGAVDIGAAASADPIQGGIALDASSGVVRFETRGGNVRLNGPVSLGSALSIDTGSGPGDFLLTDRGSIDSERSAAHDVTLQLGGGSATAAGSIGAAGPIGALRIESLSNFTSNSFVRASTFVQLSGTGTTTITGPGIVTTTTDGLGFALTGNHFLIDAAVEVASTVITTISHEGLLEISESAVLQLGGAFQDSGPGPTRLAGTISTPGRPMRFTSPLSVAGPARLDTAHDGGAGADITFEAAVSGSGSLHIDAGIAGDLLFSAQVGSDDRLGGLVVERARDLIASGDFRTGRLRQLAGSGETTFNGRLDVSGALPALINSRDVTLSDAVTAAGGLEVGVSGLLRIGESANLELGGGFRQAGSGNVELAADIQTNHGPIDFAGRLVLLDAVQLVAGPGTGDIVFRGAVIAANAPGQQLVLDAGAGSIEFQDSVGDPELPPILVIRSADDLVFRGRLLASGLVQQSGAGTTAFLDDIQITGTSPLRVQTNDILAVGRVDTTRGAAPIHFEAARTISLAQHVSSGLGSLQLLAGSGIELEAGTEIVTRDAPVLLNAGGESRAANSTIVMQPGSRIDAGLGIIELASGGSIQIGTLQNEALVRLTSHRAGVLDSGDALGPDVISAELAIRAASGVGSADPIETQVHRLAVSNSFGGGVRIENFLDYLEIGPVDGLAGIELGAAGAIDTTVPLEVFNRGTLHVTGTVRNDAGSDTVLRAEISGDLILDAPVQNHGGDGWIVLFAGGDLMINDSIPDLPVSNNAVGEAEVSVENAGAVIGIARHEVLVANAPREFAIVRTHAERFPDQDSLPPVELPDPLLDPAGFQEALLEIRERVAPQIVNVPPQLNVTAVDQGGSTIDSLGRAALRIRIGDPLQATHLERNFHLIVDWGDGSVESFPIPGNGGLTSPRFDSARLLPDGRLIPTDYIITHTYSENPNRDNPAAPIPVRVELRYDPRRAGELVFDRGLPLAESESINGIRFFENLSEELSGADGAQLQAPGPGQSFFVKVVESVVTRIEARPRAQAYFNSQQPAARVNLGTATRFGATSFEGESRAEYRVFLRIVDEVTGQELDLEFPLPLETLDDPIGLFTSRPFPNGRYRVYLEEISTRRVRLIIEVQIYEGRVVPQNFREGTGERQPGAEPLRDDSIGAPPPQAAPNDDASTGGAGGGTEFAQQSSPGICNGPLESTSDTPTAASAALGEDSQADGTTVVVSGSLIAAAGLSVWQPSDNDWAARAKQALATGRRRLGRAARLCRRLRQRTPHSTAHSSSRVPKRNS